MTDPADATRTLDVNIDDKVSVDNGRVAFRAVSDDPSSGTTERGIFTNADGTLERAAIEIPGVAFELAPSTIQNPWLDSGVVAYSARESDEFLSIHTVTRKFDSATNITTDVSAGGFPWGPNNMQVSLGSGNVAFMRTKTGETNLVINDNGSLDPVFVIGGSSPTQVPGKPPGIHFQSAANWPVLDANGTDIAFVTSTTDAGERGVYTRIGGTLDVVADESTTIPDGPILPGGSTQFTDFGSSGELSIANGNVAFLGFGGSGAARGIYTDLGGTLNKIVARDDTISIGGDTFDIMGLDFGPEGLVETSSGYSAVFWANLAGSGKAILVADIELCDLLGDISCDFVVDIGGLHAVGGCLRPNGRRAAGGPLRR